MIHLDLPHSYTIMKKAQEIDAKSVIHFTPGKVLGVQQSILQRLKITIAHLAKIDTTFSESPYVRVKLTGDRTNISRSMHCVVIAFTIIRADANPNSPRGNHTVAILNCTEDYEDLAESLVKISNEVRMIKSVTIDDVEYGIEWFLTADMKFLAIIAGIEAANARFSCIWCKCVSEDRHDTAKKWSIKNIQEGVRTIEEIKQLSKLPKRKDIEKFGCIQQPLFSIPIDHIVPDILHLFLRVSDVLINLLILELRRLDGIEKRKQNTYLDQYVKFLNEECKISFHVYTDKESKTLKWRLDRPRKIKLLNKIQLNASFPNIPHVDKVQTIWVEFKEIYEILQSNDPATDDQLINLKSRLNKWVLLFLSVFQAKHVTPYIHILVSHIPEFLSLYGPISSFSQQGLEKLNDDITKDYFWSTNHRDGKALKQLLFKLNRLEELSNDDYCRKKKEHQCHSCKMTGHNSRTCKHKQ